MAKKENLLGTKKIKKAGVPGITNEGEMFGHDFEARLSLQTGNASNKLISSGDTVKLCLIFVR